MFDSLLTPLMLQNSDHKTINETIESQINAHQQKLLRELLDRKWPRKISNDQFKANANHTEWTKIIETARI